MKIKLSSILTNGMAARLLSALLVLAFVVAVFPAPAQAATTNCAKKYTVKSGDTLYGIAASQDVVFEDLVKANDLKSPYMIIVGQVLCIPGTTSTTTTTSTSTSSSTSSNSTFNVVVTGKRFKITSGDLPAKNPYFVRVGYGWPWTNAWKKVGFLHSNKNGQASKTFFIPNAFKDANYFLVCLKDANTDELFCNRVTP